jgi:hypothetical protein
VIGLAIVAGLLLLLGVCALRGWTADSRDQRFSEVPR